MIDLEELDAAVKETRQVRREELKAQAKELKSARLARRQARRAHRSMSEPTSNRGS